MKKIILISLLVLGTLVKMQAQQIPLYSQYYYNPFLYNPAMAGATPYSNIYLIDRMQWTGIPGAPLTKAFTMDGPVSENKIGLGLSITDDQTDIFDHLGAFGSYAYNIRFAANNELRLGLSAGIISNSIDFSKVQAKDPGDAALLNQFENRTSFDGTFGASYRYNDLQLGAAIPQLLAPKLEYAQNSSMIIYYSLVRHFIGTASYTFHFSDDVWKLTPMVFTQYATGAPLLLDIGANLKYKDMAWVGLMWRKDFAVSASVGVKLNNRVTLGYSYDWMTTAISPYAGGTHEIVLGYAFGKGTGRAGDADIQKKLQELNDRQDKAHRVNKNVQDSLRNEINKTNKRIDHNDSMINKTNGNFDDFKRDMIDSLGKVRSNGGRNSGSNHSWDGNPGRNGNGNGNGGGNGTSNSGNGNGRGGNGGNSSNSNDNIPSYVLNNITFGDADAKLDPSSYNQLNELAEILHKNPNMKIEIAGYCDYRGSDEDNITLSQRRADAVKRYLLSHGAGKNQVTTKGYGKAFPIADNKTAEGMAKNRRVEMKVLSE